MDCRAVVNVVSEDWTVLVFSSKMLVTNSEISRLQNFTFSVKKRILQTNLRINTSKKEQNNALTHRFPLPFCDLRI